MTDANGEGTESRRGLSPEAFAQFLERLDPDAEEAARAYTRLEKRLTGFFNLKGDSDPARAAEETLDRAAVKIAAGAPVPDVGKYCLGIARNVAKERARRTQREAWAFVKFVESAPGTGGGELERIYGVLKPCFEQLAAEEQRLLQDYCQVLRGRARAEHRRRLAEARQTTVLALRMRVTRLRTVLTDCVRKHSGGGALQF